MHPLLLQNDPFAPVIFGVTLILCCALLGRFIARKFRQPTMLGELLMGILIGNVFYLAGYDLIGVLREGATCLEIGKLTLAGDTWDQAAIKVLGVGEAGLFLDLLRGPAGSQYLQISQAVDLFFRYGVIFLLFHLGLSASVARLRELKADSWRVALVGIVAPFSLAFLTMSLFFTDASTIQRMFLSATLVATSIGITAGTLAKLGRSYSTEAKTILSAAAIDDVIGLILLTIGTGIAITGIVTVEEVTKISLVAGIFLILALVASPYFVKFISWFLRRMDVLEAKLFISFILVLVLAGMASLLGVLSFVGAFAAGLLMMDSEFTLSGNENGPGASMKELLAPIEAILVPVFFVLVGMQVKLELFWNWHVILMLLVLLVAALAGKLVSGLVCRSDIKKLAVGVGMTPRGEMGLVFAAIGKIAGVIDAAMFSVLVLLIIVSTLVAPPLLKITLGQNPEGEETVSG